MQDARILEQVEAEKLYQGYLNSVRQYNSSAACAQRKGEDPEVAEGMFDRYVRALSEDRDPEDDEEIKECLQSMPPRTLSEIAAYDARDDYTSIIRCVTYNVLFEPKIENLENNPDNEFESLKFCHRWPAIRDVITGKEVILLQEVHTTFLKQVELFAEHRHYHMFKCSTYDKRNVFVVTLVAKNEGSKIISWSTVETHGCFSRMLVVRIVRAGKTFNIGNVHLPLDADNKGERLIATAAFLQTLCESPSIIVGDWNTLPGNGDVQQLQVANSCGTVTPWKFRSNMNSPFQRAGNPETTLFGFPHEQQKYQKYNTPAVVDRVWSTRGITVVDAVCEHIFMRAAPGSGTPSDHAPCMFGFKAV